MKKLEFKVMAWLRALREKQSVELKDKSVEERVAYYRRRAQELQDRFQKEKEILEGLLTFQPRALHICSRVFQQMSKEPSLQGKIGTFFFTLSILCYLFGQEKRTDIMR